MVTYLNDFSLIESENLVGQRKLSFINEDDVGIYFNEMDFSPYILLSVKELYTVSNNVYTSDNTMVDGATYQGSVAKKRNLVVTVRDQVQSGFGSNRGLLDEVFKSGSKGRMIVEDVDTPTKVIDYYVEQMTSTGDALFRDHQISLICPDPFFYSPSDYIVNIAEWNGAFEFVHEFLDEKEEFGWKSLSRMRTITNENTNDNIGMSITITSTGPVTNPRLTIVETQDYIQIGSSVTPLTILPGDELEITSFTGNKHVFFTHDGVRQEVNYLMTQGSKFLQLKRGNNSFGYEADAGADYMVIKIAYKLVYPRA